jgi:hypothetical protein
MSASIIKAVFAVVVVSLSAAGCAVQEEGSASGADLSAPGDRKIEAKPVAGPEAPAATFKFYYQPNGTSGDAACPSHTELKLDAELHATVTMVGETDCVQSGYTFWRAGRRWTSSFYQMKKSGTAATGIVYQSVPKQADGTPSFNESLVIRDNSKKPGAVGALVTMTEVTAENTKGPTVTYLAPNAEFIVR